jgi:hypothetical protein
VWNHICADGNRPLRLNKFALLWNSATRHHDKTLEPACETKLSASSTSVLQTSWAAIPQRATLPPSSPLHTCIAHIGRCRADDACGTRAVLARNTSYCRPKCRTRRGRGQEEGGRIFQINVWLICWIYHTWCTLNIVSVLLPSYLGTLYIYQSTTQRVLWVAASYSRCYRYQGEGTIPSHAHCSPGARLRADEPSLWMHVCRSICIDGTYTSGIYLG